MSLDSIYENPTRRPVNVLRDRHHLLSHYFNFGLAYYLYDVVAMYLVHAAETHETFRRTTDPSKWRSEGQEGLWVRVKAFCRSRWLIVLHHLVLVFVL